MTATTRETIGVVIVDDHAVYRQGLASLLAMSGVSVLGEAANAAGAMEVVGRTQPDVVLMDLNLPVVSGAEITRRIAERFPACRVLVVSVSAQEADVTEAILAGASGYVLKDGPIEEMVAGIRAAFAGESVISPRVASMLLTRIRERRSTASRGSVALSTREVEVLRLVADGRTNQEIGEVLLISASTARNHISSILTKLQVENRVQAAVQAIQFGIV